MSGAEIQKPGLDVGIEQEFGRMPLLDLNLLPQTRKEPITRENTEEIRMAITNRGPDGVAHITLWYPPMVNVLTTDRRARNYLAELNDFQDTDHSFRDFRIGVNGFRNAVIDGERRTRSLGFCLEDEGYSLERSTSPVNTRSNMPFGAAILMQMGANSHSQLTAIEEANQIKHGYEYGRANGQFLSVAEFIRSLPYTEHKIRAALKYCELPQEIKNMVEGVPADEEREILEQKPTLSYPTAVALAPLQKAILWRGQRRGEAVGDTREEATIRLMTEATFIYNKRWGADMAQRHIQALVASIRLSYSMDSLFMIEDGRQLARKRADTVYAELANDILDGSLGHLDAGMSIVDFRTLKEHQVQDLLQKFSRLQAVMNRLTEVIPAVESEEGLPFGADDETLTA